MKKTLTERVNNAREAFFADDDFSLNQIAVRENRVDLENQIGDGAERVSFDFWATAKHLLFFVPGVALLYFVTQFLTYVSFARTEDLRHFTFAFFWLGFGTFLTMFGIGKLAKLKYLKVVASVLIASFAIGLSFFFVPDQLEGKFFGSYSLYFLPIVIFTGYLTKKWIDKDDAELL